MITQSLVQGHTVMNQCRLKGSSSRTMLQATTITMIETYLIGSFWYHQIQIEVQQPTLLACEQSGHHSA